MNYPDYRPRRMRRTENLRRMIRETRLAPEDFIYPLFVVPGSGVAKPIGSLPGQFNFSVDKAVDAAAAAADLGIPAVILFGIPERRTRSAPRRGRTRAWSRRRSARSRRRAPSWW
jgi:porphobilinogen synthase